MGRGHYYPKFTEEEIEPERNYPCCLRSHESKVRYKLQSLALEPTHLLPVPAQDDELKSVEPTRGLGFVSWFQVCFYEA